MDRHRDAIFWGGHDYLYNVDFNDGGRYNPATGAWTPHQPGPDAPSPRISQGVWTGSELLVWGGDDFATGGRYNPATDQLAAHQHRARAPSPVGRPLVHRVDGLGR